MTDRAVSFCPVCGAEKPEQLYPKKGGNRHTATFQCSGCGHTWHHREAGVSEGGLAEKYVVMKEGTPVDAPSFVLLLTDPAARLAAEVYALATRNQKLRRDLMSLVALVRLRPDDYPPPGSEGQLNAGLKHRTLTSDGVSVVIIERGDT